MWCRGAREGFWGVVGGLIDRGLAGFRGSAGIGTGPDGEDLLGVVAADFGGEGMVAGDGERPGTGLGEELLKESGGVAGVGGRVEGFFERGEGVGVVHEVDLHAADVDGAGAAGAVGGDGGDGLLLCVEPFADALDIDGPGPGGDGAGVVAAAAFHDGHGLHQAVRHGGDVLDQGDGGAAERGLRVRVAGRQEGSEQHGEKGERDARDHWRRMDAKAERSFNGRSNGLRNKMVQRKISLAYE